MTTDAHSRVGVTCPRLAGAHRRTRENAPPRPPNPHGTADRCESGDGKAHCGSRMSRVRERVISVAYGSTPRTRAVNMAAFFFRGALMGGTFIVTWNPKIWSPEDADYDAELQASLAGRTVHSQWSTGSRRSGIGPGDRVFQLRQRNDRGIVASGVFRSAVFEDVHWHDPTKTAGYARIAWDAIMPIDERLPVEVLKARLPAVSWDRLQGSGVQLADTAASALEKLWSEHLRSLDRSRMPTTEQVDQSETYVEGAVEQVVVNRYERSRRARHACIAHYGVDCCVCGFNFGAFYGVAAAGYIHVHHVRELADIGKSYKLDPVKDLRPVCANCHALIHLRRPAYSIRQARRLLQSQGTR